MAGRVLRKSNGQFAGSTRGWGGGGGGRKAFARGRKALRRAAGDINIGAVIKTGASAGVTLGTGRAAQKVLLASVNGTGNKKLMAAAAGLAIVSRGASMATIANASQISRKRLR